MSALRALAVAVARVEERQEAQLVLLARVEAQLPALSSRVDHLERQDQSRKAWAAGAGAVVSVVIAVLTKLLS
jgi:hypothetical protein